MGRGQGERGGPRSVVGQELSAASTVRIGPRLDRPLVIALVGTGPQHDEQREPFHAASLPHEGTASSTRKTLPPRIFSSVRSETPRRDNATVRFGIAATSSSPIGGTTKPSKSLPSA